MRRKNSVDHANILAFILLALFSAGIISGAFWANRITISDAETLQYYLQDFFGQFSLSSIDVRAVLVDSLIKYGKYIVLLWIMGFTSPGIFVTAFVFFLKGLSYGFTTAFIVRIYGVDGVLIAFCSYFPQNIIFLPVLFFVGFQSLKFTIVTLPGLRNKPNIQVKKPLKHYGIVLIAGLLGTILAACIEVTLTPYLVEYAIR